MASENVAPLAPQALDASMAGDITNVEEATSPLSIAGTSSDHFMPPGSPSTGVEGIETTPIVSSTCNASETKQGSRRGSFLSVLNNAVDEGVAETGGGQQQRRRNSFTAKAKALFGLSNEKEVESQDNAGKLQSASVDSRSDRWRRRFSLSHDRSVERGASPTAMGLQTSLAAGSEPSSPKNIAAESRLGKWRRRLSLSKKDITEDVEDIHIGADADDAGVILLPCGEENQIDAKEAVDETACVEPGVHPTNSRRNSLSEVLKRRVSLSRRRSINKIDKDNTIPRCETGDEEDSKAERFLHRASSSSRKGKGTDTEVDEERKGGLSRFMRRLSSSKDTMSEAEQGEISEVEKESRGRRLIRRLSSSSRNSGREGEGEAGNATTIAGSKGRRRLSLLSRASRASREGSICSIDGDEKKVENSWRRKLSLASRSRDPPLPCPTGQQLRPPLKEKVSGLVKGRSRRAEDMELVEILHNPEYRPGVDILEVESSGEEDFEDGVDKTLISGAANLSEDFSLSSESSPIPSLQPDSDSSPRFPGDDDESSKLSLFLDANRGLQSCKDGSNDLNDGFGVVSVNAEDRATKIRSDECQTKLEEGANMFGYFCCGPLLKETKEEQERWNEALRYSCSKIHAQEKLFMKHPLVCRELSDEEFGSKRILCYAPTEYALDIERAY